MEWKICSVLLCGDTGEHFSCSADVHGAERQIPARGIHSGCIPQQCGDPWHCVYHEYLWQFRHGTADDHWQCAALQHYGSCCSFLHKTGTEWDESRTDQKDLKGNCDQSDHSGNSGRCIVVSLTASDANNPYKDGFQSWRSDNTSRTDGNGRCL